MHANRARIAAVLLLFPALLVAQQPRQSGDPATGPRAFTPADWYRVTTLSAPAVSPDGEKIAFTVTTVREAENRRHSEIWMVNTSGGEPVRFTSPSFSSTNPRFSADGKYLFFNSTRPGGRGNTWALRLDQPSGEAMQVPGYPDGAMSAGGVVAWSEGGSGGFGGGRGGGGGAAAAPQQANPNDPYASMQPMARPPFGAVTRPSDPARFDGRHVTEMAYKSNNAGFVPGPRDARRWNAAQIYTQSLGDTTTRRRVTDAPYSHRNVTISPDGRWIAFVADAQLRPDSVAQAERDSLAVLPYDRRRDEAERNDSDIFIIPATGGEPRRLTEFVGTETNLEWSPDSRQIAFIGRPGRTRSARVYVVDATGGAASNLLGNWRNEPSSITWHPDGRILMTSQIGGRTAVLNLDPRTRELTEILGGRRQIRDVRTDPAGKVIAYVSTSLTRPTELYVANGDGSGERKLTGFNDRLNEEVAWADAERFTYRSVGNLEIEGWLMKPHGYEPGRRYPLVLYIHGGPHSAYGEGWFDEFQNIAATGMFVLFTNPRGSSGYGADFTYSTRGRWGMEDYQDLMRAVDIVARRPDVDSTRMGVTGGSYGGFMTAWITTRTNRFKAAQADRMISDWTSWYGMSDAQGLTEFEFFGKPWDNQRLYDELSPIRHVAKVRTPTLIVQSEEDHRTPMGNAEMWFMSLKKQGVPVEFIRYPRSNHDLSRTGEPWLLVDRLDRLRQWFAHWLRPEAAVTAAGAGAGAAR